MSDENSIDHLPIEIQKAIEDLEEYEKTCTNSEMYMKALNWEMNIRDQIGMIYTLENAEKKGYEEGFKIGYDNETRAIAKRMKNLGSDLDLIAEVTGLDSETIEKL